VSASQYKSGISSLSIPYETRQLETLILNLDSFPLESLKVRQAIRYAINVPLISQNVFMDMTEKTDTPTPPGSWLHLDQGVAYEYNPQKAIELLAEEGWTDSNSDGVLDKVVGGQEKKLYLKLSVYEDPDNDVRFETAGRIKEMLKAVKIGIRDTDPRALTYEEQLQELETGSFDLAVCAFQMDVVPDPGFFLHKNNQQNYGSYTSDTMSTLIDELRKKITRDDFFYASQEIQQQFQTDIPFICLFYRSGAILTRKMYSTVRTFREYELLRGIEAFGR
jgi:peptide/nickel transport system substrate-binding protein